MILIPKGDIVFCRDCGAETAIGAKFCSQCGAAATLNGPPNCSQIPLPDPIPPQNPVSDTLLTTNTRQFSIHDHPNFIARLWNGNAGLAFSYWICTAIGPNVAFFLSFFLAISIGNINLFYFCLFIVGIFQFIAMVGTWRAAEKYRGLKIWPILARIMVAIGLLSFVFGALRIFFGE